MDKETSRLIRNLRSKKRYALKCAELYNPGMNLRKGYLKDARECEKEIQKLRKLKGN